MNSALFKYYYSFSVKLQVACDYEFDEEFFSQTSELAKDFIRKLFVKEQRRRATVDECLQHPWIQVKRIFFVLLKLRYFQKKTYQIVTLL